MPTAFHLLLTEARPRSVSQAAAARALGVCRSTISLWERGQRKPPSGDLAKLLFYYAVNEQVRLQVYDAAGE
jgi:transcriptional regulator with XRE-family HTH domain